VKITRSVATIVVGAALAAGAFAQPASADDTSSGPPATAEPNQDNASCVHGHWPEVVAGRPTNLAPGASDAIYLWHDSTGWHLRATHPGNEKKVIAGAIRSDGEIYAVARRTEGNDIVAHTANRHTIEFRFTNYGHIDGLDFKVKCGHAIRFVGREAGTKLTPAQVFVGEDNTNPRSVPVTFRRVQPTATPAT
jgi:hypothetical protein